MSSEVETTRRSSRELRCRITGACHCKSGVKFATANPSSGGPPHSKARYRARQLRKSCELNARLEAATILLRESPSCRVARRASRSCATFRSLRAAVCRSWVRRWVFSLRNGATVPEEKFPRDRAVDQARRESSPQGGENRKRADATRGHFIRCALSAA